MFHLFCKVMQRIFIAVCCSSDDPTIFTSMAHDDVINWKYFPRYWPFVRGIHQSPVNSPQKGQWRGALMFTLMCTRINGWVNNREAGDLRRHHAHSDVIVMLCGNFTKYCHKRQPFVFDSANVTFITTVTVKNGHARFKVILERNLRQVRH